MPKYSLVGTVTGGKYLGEVEAATAAEAVALGYGLESAMCSICHQCSLQIEDPEITDIVASEVEDDA